MKKLLILLAAVTAVGAVSMYMLENHSDMQVKLPTAYETTQDAGDTFMPEESTGEFNIKFSQKKTFYDHDIDVEITCGNENAVIYYTTDGNTPDENAKVYSGPIHLGAKSAETCTTIKAFAADGDEKTDIAVKSYIVGRNISERFGDDTLVFVLSADEYDLYDYYHGIAVEGYLRDEYMKNEYKGGEINPTAPANYNIGGRESERPMYVEVYDSKGDQLISQAAGARVVGGYSRAVDQKSWRLIARKEYSEDNGKFKYPFFLENTDPAGNFITRYDRITLRNGANDREFAGVRDELSMTLAFDAGLADAQAVTPAAVYLNGKYYGFAWLHEAYCNGYLESMYGGNKDNFRIVGSKELDVDSDDENDAQAVADWEHVIRLAEKDLTQDLYFSEFCRLVDIDDLMLYYAMQIYIDNKDWPGNNFKVWRYYPSEGEKVTSPYLDGKWRFLFFDAEFAWGLYGAGYKDDTLKAVLTGKHMQGASHILSGLLARDDMKEKFADTMCELRAGVFDTKNVNEKLDALIALSDPEQMHALKLGIQSGWANEWTFADSRQQIREFAERRPWRMDEILNSNLKLSGEKYFVTVRAPSGSDVKAGCLKVDSGGSVSITYRSEYKAYLTALPYDGYEPDHWEINGKVIEGGSIAVDRSMADVNGNILADLYVKKTPVSGSVHVSALYTSGEDDRVEITNTTDSPIRLKGWHLSDKGSQPDRFTLPDMEIAPGDTVSIVMKDNNDTSALMKHQTNFSLKVSETLYFSDPDMELISEVPVLPLEKSQYLSLGADGVYHITS